MLHHKFKRETLLISFENGGKGGGWRFCYLKVYISTRFDSVILFLIPFEFV